MTDKERYEELYKQYNMKNCYVTICAMNMKWGGVG